MMAPPAARCGPVLTTLYSFAGGADGGHPVAGLASAGPLLYGTTPDIGGSQCAPQCGTVFALDPATGSKTILHVFAGRNDGSNPQAALLYVAGKLFGTTATGGPYGQGTVFDIDLARGTTKTLHSFAGGTDGASPMAALIDVGGVLYGTTASGGSGPCGASGCGTIFALDRASGAETTLYAFRGGTDGQAPQSRLLDAGGTLYGTTLQGGGMGGCAGGCGTAFDIDPMGGAEAVLHAFAGGSDGAGPRGRLIRRRGAIYGATVAGGGSDSGTVFKMNFTGGQEAVIHSFTGADGSQPESGLAGARGPAYGLAASGGKAGAGTLFSVDPKSGAGTVLYDFTGQDDGGKPIGELVSVGGLLYGTTSTGGSGGYGTVFRVQP
jgi:uncharacterized repeat protein (TIGR03803 family)